MSDALERLVNHLAVHEPGSPREERSLRRMLAMIRWLERPFDEEADPTHITASAIVIDEAGSVVLHRHKRLGIWLQPGGHVDPGETPESAVLREVLEETGAAAEHALGDRPLHVDVHEGPRGHVHLDVRYLLTLPPGTPFAPAPDESQDVAWLPYTEAASRSDSSLADAIAAAERVSGRQ